jgi:nitroreductase
MIMQIDTTPDVNAAISRRRAVRGYTAAHVDASTIRELLLAAVQAPTAMHLEPWGFVVIQDKRRLQRYSDRAKQMLLEQRHSDDSMLHAGDPHAHEQEHLAMLADPAFNIFYNAGTLIVICRRTGGAFADADCWLAAQNLMLAATAMGLGTCCIGFAVPVLNAADVKQELGIPDAGAAVAPIIVGVPSGASPLVPRKDPEILAWLE